MLGADEPPAESSRPALGALRSDSESAQSDFRAGTPTGSLGSDGAEGDEPAPPQRDQYGKGAESVIFSDLMDSDRVMVVALDLLQGTRDALPDTRYKRKVNRRYLAEHLSWGEDKVTASLHRLSDRGVVEFESKPFHVRLLHNPHKAKGAKWNPHHGVGHPVDRVTKRRQRQNRLDDLERRKGTKIGGTPTGSSGSDSTDEFEVSDRDTPTGSSGSDGLGPTGSPGTPLPAQPVVATGSSRRRTGAPSDNSDLASEAKGSERSERSDVARNAREERAAVATVTEHESVGDDKPDPDRFDRWLVEEDPWS